MPYPATVHNVFIASPGDVRPERQVARQVISAWNAVHSEAEGAILEALGWDTHAYPEMGERPQGIINRLVVKSDILVAIFWARLGSPTGVASSGTVEEIENHLESNRPTMIYFSNAPVPTDVDTKQLENVRALRRKYESEGLIGTFASSEDFRTVFTQDLAATMVEYLKSQPPQRRYDAISPTTPVSTLSLLDTSIAAIRLLQEAARSESREILRRNVLGGFQISVNRKDFIKDGERITQARWKVALGELERQRFVEAVGGGGLYRVTYVGDVFLERLSVEILKKFKERNELYVNVRLAPTPPHQLVRIESFDYVVRVPKATVEDRDIEWNLDYILEDGNFKALVASAASSVQREGQLREVGGSWEAEVDFFFGNPKSLSKHSEQTQDNCRVWLL